MRLLYPQIDRIEARLLMRRYLENTDRPFEPDIRTEKLVYSPLGGTRVQGEGIAALRQSCIAAAMRAGWPNDSSLDARRRLDRILAQHLHEALHITAHEASLPGIWQFLCCAVLPDVVMWRFPPRSESASDSRFLGGVKNALQRLWWRAEILRDATQEDPYALLGELMEDEFVQLMERPAIARHRPMARALVRTFAANVGGGGGDAIRERMELMRDAAKRILRMGAVLAFDVMDEDKAAAIARIELLHARNAVLAQRTRVP